MLNSKSQAGTEVQQSDEVDVTTSSPNNAKLNVVCSASCQNELLTIYDANNIFRDVIAKYNLEKSLNEMRNQGYFVNTDI
jgi:hypothetical protein